MVSVDKEHLINQICLFLIDKAQRKETTTYQTIAEQFGLPASGNSLSAAVSPLLGAIFEWCESVNIPPLTSIVVRKSGTRRGCPGKGFWVLYNAGGDFTVVDADDTKQVRDITGDLHQMVFEFFDIGKED